MKKIYLCLLSALLLSSPAFSLSHSNVADNSNHIAYKVEDSSIASQIKHKIQSDPLVNSLKVDITVRKGDVELTGLVETNTQAEKIVTFAQSVDGVNNVNAKNLKVKNSKEVLTDTYITAKVKGVLIKENLLDIRTPGDIRVETKNRVVYVSGYVDDRSQVDKIVDNVKSIKDVKKVVNGLKVRS